MTDTPHAAALDLDFYANDTLNPGARGQVESHLTACASCRADLVVVRRMRAAVQAEAAATPEPRTSFEAIQGRLDAFEAGRSWWRAWLPGLAPVPRWVPAAALLLLIAQSVTLAAIGAWWLADRPSVRSLAGGTPAPSGPRLHVIFSPDTTESEIRAALGQISGRIVDGPTALGVYTVAIEPGSGLDASAAAARLREAGSMVRFAEPAPRG